MAPQLAASIEIARAKLRAVAAVVGLLWTLVGLAVACTVSFHSDRAIVTSESGRWAWFAVLFVLFPLAALIVAALACLRRIPDTDVAIVVEHRFPEFSERLITAVELSAAGAGVGASQTIADSMISDVGAIAARIDAREAVALTALRRPGSLALAALALIALQIAIAPNAWRVWALRMLYPAADIPVFARTMVYLHPGDAVIARGDSAQIVVETTGRKAERAVLRMRQEHGAWAERVLTTPVRSSTAPGRWAFKTTMPGLQRSMEYEARANDGRSNPYTIRVEDRPAIVKVRMRLRYPAYTGRPPETLEASAANVAAVKGTRVAIDAQANKDLASATMQAPKTPDRPWRIAGRQASTDLSVMRDSSYRLQLADRNGFRARPAPEYAIHALPDRAPAAQILKPAADLERAPGGSIDLRSAAVDDYGVADLRWVYRVAGRSGSQALPMTRGAGTTVGSAARVRLGPLRLKAGDTVTYEVNARDGDTVSGPKTGRSPSFRIQIVSAAEVRDRVDARAAAEHDALVRALRTQKASMAAAERARQSATPEMDLRRSAQLQRDAARQVAEVARSMAETARMAQDNGVLSPSDEQQRRQIQATMERLSRTDMPSAASTLSRAADQPAERPSSMDSARDKQESIREQLERALGDTQPTAAASELAQAAADLARQERDLAQRSATAAERLDATNGTPTQQNRAEMAAIARAQSEVRSATRELERRLDRAASEAAASGSPEAAALQRSSADLQRAQVPSTQAASERDLANSRPEAAAQRQSDAARRLEEAAASLENASGMPRTPNALEKAAAALDAAADKLMQLANSERTIQQGAQANPAADASQKLASSQKSIEGATRALDSALRYSPAAQDAASRAADHMNTAEKALRDTKPADAVQPARDAGKGLLQAAMEARETARQLGREQDAREAQAVIDQMARDEHALRAATAAADRAKPALDQAKWREQTQTLASKQSELSNRGWKAHSEMPTAGAKDGLATAIRRMDEARRLLQDEQQASTDTRRQQLHAAQILERVSQALMQEAESARQQAEASQSGAEEQRMAAARAELRMARDMEAQLKQETAGLDARRSPAPDKPLTPNQQRELNSLAETQGTIQNSGWRLTEMLRETPQQGAMRALTDEMGKARQNLAEKQTGAQTQERQQQIVGGLDQALREVEQSMSEQQRRMARRPGQQKPGQQRTAGQPNRGDGPIVQPQQGGFVPPGSRGHVFGGLSARAQQSLQSGKQERVPAEYRDLVSQYYRALSERGR